MARATFRSCPGPEGTRGRRTGLARRFGRVHPPASRRGATPTPLGVEAQVVTEKLFLRFAKLSLAVPPTALRYTGGLGIRALTALPVRLTRGGAAYPVVVVEWANPEALESI